MNYAYAIIIAFADLHVELSLMHVPTRAVRVKALLYVRFQICADDTIQHGGTCQSAPIFFNQWRRVALL